MSVNNIYRSDEFFRQAAEQRLWTAWRTETRLNKTTGELKETKVPYCGIGVKSESDDPLHGLTLRTQPKLPGLKDLSTVAAVGSASFLGSSMARNIVSAASISTPVCRRTTVSLIGQNKSSTASTAMARSHHQRPG